MIDKIMLFPGQGTQFIGMGKSLYNAYSTVRQTYEEAGDILGFDIANLCFNDPAEKLKHTAYAQIAILTTSVSAFRQFQMMYQVAPSLCAGHSLGEYTALVCAEAASFADILQLVRYRGELMAETTQTEAGTMTAVEGMAPSLVAQLCTQAREQGEYVWIAAFNTPNQVVISGRSQSVDKVAKQCGAKGAKIVSLSIVGAFHTPMMAKAAESLQERLNQLKWKLPKFPVIANVTAMPYTTSNELPIQLASQMIMPVRWSETLTFALSQNPCEVLAFPPKNIMANMIQQESNEIRIFSLQNEQDLISYGRQSPLNDIEEKKTVQLNEIDLISLILTVAVSTKNNNEEDSDYKERVVYPYRCLEDMHDAYVSGQPLTSELKCQALEWLASILEAKKLSEPKKSAILLEMSRLG